MEYKEFIEKYTEAAIKADLSKLPNVYKILEGQRIKFEAATLDAEIIEVKEFCSVAIKELKHKLRTAFINRVYIGTYVNHTAPFIFHLKLFFEYTDLYNKAIEYQQSKNKNQPQQEPNKKKEKLHPQVFRDNGFEVWQSMFESFDIKESSLTDIRFMYEAMKNDNLIFETIGEKNLRDWIAETYGLVISRAKYTSPTWKSNKKRMAIYSDAKEIAMA